MRISTFLGTMISVFCQDAVVCSDPSFYSYSISHLSKNCTSNISSGSGAQVLQACSHRFYPSHCEPTILEHPVTRLAYFQRRLLRASWTSRSSRYVGQITQRAIGGQSEKGWQFPRLEVRGAVWPSGKSGSKYAPLQDEYAASASFTASIALRPCARQEERGWRTRGSRSC